MPVEAVSTASGGTLRWRLTHSASVRLSASPCSPLQALALPALMRTARAVPPRTIRREYCTHAAWTRFVVKTPATVASLSLTSRHRSSPSVLRPARTPEATKPSGNVTPAPSCSFQTVIMRFSLLNPRDARRTANRLYLFLRSHGQPLLFSIRFLAFDLELRGIQAGIDAL